MGGFWPPPRIPNLRTFGWISFSDGCAQRCDMCDLRGLGCDRVALPTTRWHEKNTVVQELVSIVVRGDDNP
jgi:hypothetical protein